LLAICVIAGLVFAPLATPVSAKVTDVAGMTVRLPIIPHEA